LLGLSARLGFRQRRDPDCVRCLVLIHAVKDLFSLLLDVVNLYVRLDLVDIAEHISLELKYLRKKDRARLVIVHLEPPASWVFNVYDVVSHPD